MARSELGTPQRETVGLGRRTARGFYWLMLQMLGSKAISLLSQIALGWLLAPNDFDLIALVLTVTALLGQLRDAGMREVLVHRHRNFARWAGAAFWLALTMGVIVGLLTLASIPIALAVYQRPELAGLLIVSSIGAPINTLGTVSDALIRSQMRFRLLSIVSFGVYAGTMTMTVVLAALGFGAYSWVIPQPVMWLVRAVVLWWVAKPNFSMKPRFRRWRYLIGDNLRLMGSDFAMVASLQGDRTVLGMMFPSQPFAGIYFFAINLSEQSVRLFVVNLTNVLFPALAKLQDDAVRQVRAFLRATSLLALVGVPLCLVQMPLADSMIKLLFPAKWNPAVGVVQLLSIGMVGRLMAAPSRSMLMAQGRFNVLMWMSTLNSVTFIGAVVIGAVTNGLLGVAACASVAMFLYGPVQIYVAATPGGGTWRDVWKTYALPLVASVVAIAVAWPASELLAWTARALLWWIVNLVANGNMALMATGSILAVWGGRVVEFVCILLLTLTIYLGIVAKIAPAELQEVKLRLRDMLNRTRKKKQPPTLEEIEKDADDVEAVEEIKAPGD